MPGRAKLSPESPWSFPIIWSSNHPMICSSTSAVLPKWARNHRWNDYSKVEGDCLRLCPPVRKICRSIMVRRCFFNWWWWWLSKCVAQSWWEGGFLRLMPQSKALEPAPDSDACTIKWKKRGQIKEMQLYIRLNKEVHFCTLRENRSNKKCNIAFSEKIDHIKSAKLHSKRK